MEQLPLFLNLRGRTVVLVGEGEADHAQLVALDPPQDFNAGRLVMQPVAFGETHSAASAGGDQGAAVRFTMGF